MKKIEFERMLMDPEGIKAVAERAKVIKEKYGESEAAHGLPASRQRFVEPRGYEVRPTPEEIRINDDDHFARGNLMAEVNHFLPEDIAPFIQKSEKADAREILAKLVERCRKEPSQPNQFLVEDAINWLTSAGEPDSKTEKLIEEAINILGQPREGSDSIWSRFYQHSNYGGWSYFLNHGPGWVYRLVSWIGSSYNDAISSLFVGTSTGDRGEMILFEHDQFRGRYARFSGTPGTTVWTNYVGGFMNDRTSSILAVRRFNPEKEVSVALGSLGLRGRIAEYAAGIERISLRGDPILTWDMWPSFSPSRRYIYLRIPVTVDVPNWWDYDAEIRYWVYLYVNSAGNLGAYVDWYGCWVESGVKSGSIANRIMEALPGTLGTINTELANAIALVAPLLGPLERQYFLPGIAGNTGHTEDDVTIVLVRR